MKQLNKEQRVRLTMFCAEQVIGIYEEEYPQDLRLRNFNNSAKKWLENSGNVDESLVRLFKGFTSVYYEKLSRLTRSRCVRFAIFCRQRLRPKPDSQYSIEMPEAFPENFDDISYARLCGHFVIAAHDGASTRSVIAYTIVAAMFALNAGASEAVMERYLEELVSCIDTKN